VWSSGYPGGSPSVARAAGADARRQLGPRICTMPSIASTSATCRPATRRVHTCADGAAGVRCAGGQCAANERAAARPERRVRRGRITTDGDGVSPLEHADLQDRLDRLARCDRAAFHVLELWSGSARSPRSPRWRVTALEAGALLHAAFVRMRAMDGDAGCNEAHGVARTRRTRAGASGFRKVRFGPRLMRPTALARRVKPAPRGSHARYCLSSGSMSAAWRIVPPSCSPRLRSPNRPGIRCRGPRRGVMRWPPTTRTRRRC
jgi:hypothetical protein